MVSIYDLLQEHDGKRTSDFAKGLSKIVRFISAGMESSGS